MAGPSCPGKGDSNSSDVRSFSVWSSGKFSRSEPGWAGGMTHCSSSIILTSAACAASTTDTLLPSDWFVSSGSITG